jgi:hypothetical protein
VYEASGTLTIYTCMKPSYTLHTVELNLLRISNMKVYEGFIHPFIHPSYSKFERFIQS